MGIVIGLLSFVLILVCLLLGLLVLIQLPKKEAGFGMAFGAGAVDTLLGAGGGNALTKITKWVAGIFLGLCIVLSFLNNKANSSANATRGVRDAASRAATVAPASTAPTAAVATPIVADGTNAAAPLLKLSTGAPSNAPASK
jgi:preprotein translocase subunit SecG